MYTAYKETAYYLRGPPTLHVSPPLSADPVGSWKNAFSTIEWTAKTESGWNIFRLMHYLRVAPDPKLDVPVECTSKSLMQFEFYILTRHT